MQKTKNKILIIGNEMNIPLYMSFILKEAGYEVVQIFKTSLRKGKIVKTDNPENEFPELKSIYPAWLHQFEPIDKMFGVPFRSWNKIGNISIIWRLHKPIQYIEKYMKFRHFQKKVKALHNEFNPDLIITRGHEICHAHQFNSPILMTAFGSDIYETPLADTGIFDIFYSAWRRRILRKHVNTLLTAADYIFFQALNYKIKKVVRFYVPPSPGSSNADFSNVPKDVAEQLTNADIVFFSPMRFIANKNSSAYKGNDIFLESIARYKKSTDKNFILLLLESGYKNETAQRFLKENGLLENIIFLKGDDNVGGRITRQLLWALMSHPKIVVFDRFKFPRHANFGGTAREAMAAGAVLICGTEIETDTFQSYHPPDCPAISVRSADELEDAMHYVSSLSSEEMLALREKTKAWQTASSENLWQIFRGEVDLLLKTDA